MLRDGWNLSGNENEMVLTKGAMAVHFDIVIPTPKGQIFCMYFKRSNEVTRVAASKSKKLPILTVHGISENHETSE